MKKTRNVFYRVVPSPSFSQLYAETVEEARDILEHFGDCPNGTPENKAYWKKEQAKCKIVKVIEIVEEVE